MITPHPTTAVIGNLNDHHKCSYFCCIELMILPERATSSSFLTMIEETTDLRRKATLVIQFYSLEIPIKKSIRKPPGSMLFPISESSDHLPNSHFHTIAQDFSPKNIGYNRSICICERETDNWPIENLL